MGRLVKIVCAIILVITVVPGSLFAQARGTFSPNQFTCARYGVSVTGPATWQQQPEKCDSEKLLDGHVSLIDEYVGPGAQSLFDVVGIVADSSMTVPYMERTAWGAFGLNMRNAHFSPKVINGLTFHVASVTATNTLFNASAWTLVAVIKENGLFLTVVGSAHLSQSDQLTTAMQEISEALGSVRFTTPLILTLSGTGNKESATFTVSGPLHLNWSIQPATGDTTDYFGGSLRIKYGLMLDIPVNYRGRSKRASIVIHEDCSGGCRLQVESKGSWTIKVTQ